jgi:hypothetical protein
MWPSGHHRLVPEVRGARPGIQHCEKVHSSVRILLGSVAPCNFVSES